MKKKKPLQVTRTGLPGEELVTVESRPGVVQAFVLIKPVEAVAAVILFAGGPGRIGLSERNGQATIHRDTNFLVRSRWLFAEHGFAVVVVDSPTDRQGKRGMLGGFRNTADHVADIDATIAYLTTTIRLPVWLVGTSRGTESAAYVGIHGSRKIDGLVLTSSIVKSDGDGTSLTDLALAQISAPVLLVAHNDDQCYLTPRSGVEPIARALVNSTDVGIRYFDGGDRPISGPCEPLCQHGFLGIEHDVVAEIARFISSSRK